MPREVSAVTGKTIARLIVPSGTGDDTTTIIRIEFTDGTFFELDLEGLTISNP
jgi:hypothetical protein